MNTIAETLQSVGLLLLSISILMLTYKTWNTWAPPNKRKDTP